MCVYHLDYGQVELEDRYVRQVECLAKSRAGGDESVGKKSINGGSINLVFETQAIWVTKGLPLHRELHNIQERHARLPLTQLVSLVYVSEGNEAHSKA
jgi:hypothetical protein